MIDSFALSCLALNPRDPAVVTVLAVMALLVLIIGWTRKYQNIPGNHWFLGANIAMLWWLATTAFELSSSGAGCKIAWAQLAWPGILLMPTSWALFLYEYALARKVSRRVQVLAIWVVPIAFTALALSNEQHHQLYTEATRLVETPDRSFVRYDHGPAFYMAIGYVYVFIAGASIVAGYATLRAAPIVRRFFVKLLAITFLPVAANLTYVLGGVTVFGIDPTPFMFSFCLAAIVWLIADNRWVDVNAIARELLFFNAHDVYLVCDPNGQLYGCNPEAQNVFGRLLPGDNLRGLPHVGPLIDRLDEIANATEPTLVNRDNRSFVVRIFPMSFEPVKASIGWVLALVDVTAQQKAAETMREAALRAEAADRAKTQFLSTVSHELRTPLTVIKGSLELINNTTHKLPPEKTAKLLAMAQDNAKSLAALVDDLLELQRLENAQLSMVVEPIELNGLARDALASLGSYQAQKGVELRLVSDGTAMVVQGDRQRLRQVLANVLSNAIKFSDPGGEVVLKLDNCGSHARISVTDKGMGIPEGARDKVFGRFTQVDSSDSRQMGGSGLGMHITSQILKQHNATIDYVSTLGEGATFFIDIPLLLVETADPAPESAGTAPSTAPAPNAPVGQAMGNDRL